MKRIVFVILFFTSFQGCIPLNNVHTIDNYEIKEGKWKSRKQNKRYTKFIISNYSSPTIALKYLNTKFKVFLHKNTAYVSHKIFMDVDINFNLEFEFTSKTKQYLDLVNLFMQSKNDKNDLYSDDENDDPLQYWVLEK